ncbi:hypothetical protein KY289_000125 [Solanum tuberosum]|nr:hypothetical protein KY289_000125 [Solanum tuberosum]
MLVGGDMYPVELVEVLHLLAQILPVVLCCFTESQKMTKRAAMSSSAVLVRDNVINLEVCERPIRSEGESLNKLDDDTLVQILCGLPLKDAARTSVLSRRWRHLWRRSLMYPLNNM